MKSSPFVFLFVLLVLVANLPAAAQTSTEDGVWSRLGRDEFRHLATKSKPWIQPDRFEAIRLDGGALDAVLSLAPQEKNLVADLTPTILRLPTPDGDFERFEVVESSVMHPDLERWLADQGWPMRTFKGRSLDRAGATVRLDWGGPAGFHAMVLASGRTFYIDPRWSEDREHYVSYFKHDYRPRGKHFTCGVAGHDSTSNEDPTILDLPRRSSKMGAGTGGNLRSYRLAMAATGEYTTFHGGTAVAGQAAIVTTINRVNQVYERELSLRMVLVANNQSLVYTNGATDPYTNDDGFTMLFENQSTIDSVIGSANYDIGHVVSTGGGGIAGLGVPCDAAEKAEGVTGSDQPVGDPFDIDFVAHELGHQWGGNHTFNSVIGSCDGNRNASTAYEPGSGTSIQSYAGICDADNVQANSDDFFHGVSLDEMLNYIAADGACSTQTSAANPNAPTVNAGANHTIPVRTPFELTAVGNDVDGDSVTYAWEQFDLGNAASLVAGDNGSNPIFRAWDPTSSPTRTFPRLNELLANTTPTGETLPTTSRAMTFRVTVRDNAAGGGRVGEDTMTLTSTTQAGPFLVTSPNGGESLSGMHTVTWDVAGTASAPVSASTVDILLSTDGGQTYPTVLASSTPNDGSHEVTLPSTTTSTARIKVRGSGHVFFDISNANFSIGGGAPPPPPSKNCRNPALDLADPGSVSDTMMVVSGDTLTDLDVSLEITHSYVGDVTVVLEHLDTGTSVTLVDRPGVPADEFGCNGTNIVVTLDDEGPGPVENECTGSTPTINGTFTPNSALSAFDGENLSGNWRLTVTDAVGQDSGTLTEWCLVPTTEALPPSEIFDDGFESGGVSEWSSSVGLLSGS